jgi:hypothetical protein
MLSPEQFETKITYQAKPPKGWIWVLAWSIVKKWLYENAETILPIFLERLFGAKKAAKITQCILVITEED